MKKHDDVVQNLNGTAMPGVVIQVMLAFTSTPATIYSDRAGQNEINVLRTDSLGRFEFYAPNGRYDIFANVGGSRVAHDTDILVYDPEDDTRVTTGGSGSGGNGGSGGAGGGTGGEAALVIDSGGGVTPNKDAGANFTVAVDRNLKLVNPVGYAAGDKIRVLFRQDDVGGHTLNYDTLYAVPNAQPPVMSVSAKALDKIEIDVTQGPNGLEYVLTPFMQAYSTVLPLARIGTALYYVLANALNTGAFNLIQPEQTVYIIRDGVGPEATGTIRTTIGPSAHFTIAGAPVNGRRPIIRMLQNTRPSYGKAVLNFEDSQTVTIRDLVITGARNVDGDARGIAPNSGTWLTVRNVEVTDCNNGILWGNDDFTGGVDMFDCRFDSNGNGNDGNGISKNAGFTHNIYAGHNNQSWSATRCSFTNSISGHDVKSRALMCTLNQVLAKGSQTGRELNLPVGGGVVATNSVFWKLDNTVQNSLGGIGEEGMDLSRNRVYRFTNCTFQNDITGGGRDVTFLINFDPTVKMEFIDCQFIGEQALATNTDVNNQFPGMITEKGMRFMPGCDPIYTLTGGPVGPLLPAGYFPVAMTPVVG